MKVPDTRKPKISTLRDVARVASVSVSAASAALNNGNPKYSRKTAARIRAVARQLNYRPNRSAQFVRTGKNKLIGMIFFGGSREVSNERAHSIAQSIDEQGYELMMLSIHSYRGGLSRIVDRLLESSVSGVIIAGPRMEEAALDPVFERGIPVVGASTNEIRKAVHVRADFRQAMRAMTEHLLSRGHRTIVSWVLPETSTSRDPKAWIWQARGKALGVGDAMTAAGYTWEIGDKDDYLRWIAKRRDNSRPAAFTVFEAYGEDFPEDIYEYGKTIGAFLCETGHLPDVIVFPDDEGAIGGMGQFYRAGIRVPEDIGVTGFDDSSLAKNFIIPLTSVRQPIRDMARRTVELCIRQIENPGVSISPRLIHLPCELIVRESSGGSRGSASPPMASRLQKGRILEFS